MEMKKTIVTYLMMAVAFVGVVASVHMWPRELPASKCGEVYQRFQDMEDMEASYVKDYEIDDSTRVDVTVLHATSDSSWLELVKAFGFRLTETIEDNGIGMRRAPRINPYATIGKAAPDDYVITYFRDEHTVYLFDSQNESVIELIAKAQFKRYLNKLVESGNVSADEMENDL